MNCMKCGVEIADDQAFCQSCLAEMKHYPVKPELRIQLPSRPDPEVSKKQPPRKRAPTTEEKLSKLQSIVKWLVLFLIASLLFLGFTVSMLLREPPIKDTQENIGQNYNTISPERRIN